MTNLEKQLAGLTEWRGEDTALWKKALESPRENRGVLARLVSVRVPRWAVAASILIIGVLVIGVLSPSLGKARQSARQLKDSTQVRGILQGQHVFGDQYPLTPRERSASDAPALHGLSVLQSGQGGGGGDQSPYRGDVGWNAIAGFSAMENIDADLPRQVIQRATLELKVKDVKATFLKCQMLLQSGEFVQESSLSGEAENAAGNLTLRVESARLSEVLNALRALGEVVGMQNHAEDVTGQMVDLEARITNERSVEREMLELLEKRRDAPLEDILKLRQRLSEVRESIERMNAQRTRLARLVDLATVLVIIRAADKPPEPKPAGMWTHVSNTFTGAWREGLLATIDTAAWLAGRCKTRRTDGFQKTARGGGAKMVA